MKKLLFFACSLSVVTAYTQTTWNTGLNSPSGTAPKLGTANNFPIDFYTQNVRRMSLSATGDFKIDGLSGDNSRIMLADATGIIGASAFQVVSGNFNLTTGKLGIGVSTPTTAIDVNGSVKLTGNMVVKKSILLGSSDNDLTIFNFSPGTSTQPSLIQIVPAGTGAGSAPGSNGDFVGPNDPEGNWCGPGSIPNFALQAPQMLNVIHRAYVSPSNPTEYRGNVNMGHNGDFGYIESQGNYTVSGNYGDLRINSSCGRNVYFFGGGDFEETSSSVLNVHGKLNVQSNMQLGSPTGTSFTDNSVKLFIDASTSNGIKIRKNGTSGLVAMKLVEYNSSDHALSVYQTSNSSDGVEKFHVRGDGSTYIGTDLNSVTNTKLSVGLSTKTDKAFAIMDNTSPTSLKDVFTVYGNGYTEIRVQAPTTMPKPFGTSGETYGRVLTVRDMSQNGDDGIDLFVVKADGKVYAREVEISLVNTFPDYVFGSGYCLPKIGEVREFIRENKHLPGFEVGTEYEKNGLELGDIVLKQQVKIEELMLYIIQLEERLNKIESKN